MTFVKGISGIFSILSTTSIQVLKLINSIIGTSTSDYFCGAIYAPRGRSYDLQIEEVWLQQMKEEKAKLHVINEKGERDLLKLRLPKFDNIFSKLGFQQKETISADLVDNLFSFEESWIVHKTFVKIDTDVEGETSISYLIWLDAFIADFIDLLSQANECTKLIL